MGVVAELLGQDQQTIEGGAQLVGHVGQEFRLILGRQRQLRGLVLQLLLGLFDLVIRALHFGLLCSQQARSLFQLSIGLLQLSLLVLQLLRQGLRLFE